MVYEEIKIIVHKAIKKIHGVKRWSVKAIALSLQNDLCYSSRYQ